MNPLRCWKTWLAFLDRRELGTSLAFFRIAIGSCIVLMLCHTWMAGAVNPLWMDSADGKFCHLGNNQSLRSSTLFSGNRPERIL